MYLLSPLTFQVGVQTEARAIAFDACVGYVALVLTREAAQLRQVVRFVTGCQRRGFKWMKQGTRAPQSALAGQGALLS